MRACTPHAAPPAAKAIVTSKAIVRPVSITFAPPECRWRGAYHTAFLVRLSSNGRYSHQSIFEREPDIGERARILVHAPLPGRRKPPVLDGRADHRGPGPRPRHPDGLPAVRRRQETGA